jgi:DNA-binding NarL/FixJ family response regulator
MTSTLKPIRVVLADDHDLVRSGIKALLLQMRGLQVLAEARDGNELLALLVDIRPDVVVTDISMPGMDGIAACAQIAGRYPDIRMLVLSMDESLAAVKSAVAAGARGFLRKDAPQHELELAVRSLADGRRYFGAGIAQLLLQPAEPGVAELLTERQVGILTLIAEGKSAKEIGFALGISSKTVDVHRAKIMERLGLADVASLTRYALRKGLVKA